jgi:hypothetical protein
VELLRRAAQVTASPRGLDAVTLRDCLWPDLIHIAELNSAGSALRPALRAMERARAKASPTRPGNEKRPRALLRHHPSYSPVAGRLGLSVRGSASRTRTRVDDLAP